MAEAKHDIQDTGQLVARADRLVDELRETLSRVAQSASDEGPQVQLVEWSPPSEEEPTAQDALPSDEDFLEADEEELTDAEESESDVLEEPKATAVPGASVTPESPAEPEALVEPEAPAEPEALADSEAPAEPEALADSEAPAEPEALVELEAPAEPEALVELEAPAEPEALAEPEAPAELGSSESATSQIDVPESAEPDEPTAQKAPPAEDAPDTMEQPSILVSADEAEQMTPPPDEAVLGNEKEAVINSDEDSTDSGWQPQVIDATNEPEGKPEMVMVEDKEQAPSVESELLVDATAEAGDTAEARERVRSLDSELARLADSMIEGEVDDERSVLVDDDPPSDEAGSESADLVAAETPRDEPSLQPAPPRRDPVAVADDPGGGVLYHLRRAAAAAWRLLERHLPTLAGEFGPTAHNVCQRASGPVNKRPPFVRRAVGFVAIVTAMYAAAVLVYVAVLRKPPEIDGENTGMSLVSGSDEVVAGRGDD